MQYTRWRKEWGELAIMAVLSFFLYQLSMAPLFCIPLQVLFLRRGEKQLLYGCGAVLVAIGIASLIRTSPVPDMSFRRGLLLIEIGLPAFLVAGVVAVNLRWKWRMRVLYKILAVTAVAGICSIPFVLALGRSENFQELLATQIDTVTSLLAGPDGNNAGLLPDTEALSSLIVGLLLRTYVFGLFLTIGGTLWVGRAFANRMPSGYQLERATLRTFSLPDRMIWGLLVPWALVLLDLRMDIGILRYFAWNAGLVGLFLFGMQGVGILQTLLDRTNIPRGARLGISAIIIVMMFWPGVNVIVFIGFPGLGVSELWIHYRKEQKEKENDEID